MTIANKRKRLRERHRASGTREYFSYSDARARCFNPNNPSYPDYGARGITMDPVWDSFVRFFADMGRCPRGLTLHRIDNDGDYRPGNCKWATPAEQNRAKRNNRLLTFEGSTLCVADWAIKTGLRHDTILKRLDELKWSIERSLTTPRRTWSRQPRQWNYPLLTQGKRSWNG